MTKDVRYPSAHLYMNEVNGAGNERRRSDRVNYRMGGGGNKSPNPPRTLHFMQIRKARTIPIEFVDSSQHHHP